MHPVLEIPELATIICRFCQDENPADLVAVAATCRGMYGPAMDLIWRELDDFSPLIKCLPQKHWRETRREDRGVDYVTLVRVLLSGGSRDADVGVFVSQELIKLPVKITAKEWRRTFRHAERVRKISWTQRHTLESGTVYEISWRTVSDFGHWLRRRPGDHVVPLLNNLKVFHVDFYERGGRYQVSEGTPYVAGPALREMYWHCQADAYGFGTDDVVDVTRAIGMVPVMSPELSMLGFFDERGHAKTDPNAGLSGALRKLAHLRSFSSTLSLHSSDVASLSRMSRLTQLSAGIYTDEPILPPNPSPDTIPFGSLQSLKLSVKELSKATAFLNLLGDATILRKFTLETSMSNSESAFEACFKAIARHKFLEEVAININSTPVFTGPFITYGVINTAVLAILYELPEIRIFVVNALDSARFETNLDDASMQSLALKWPHLRKLTIVQGSASTRGLRVPFAKTTLVSLMHLRNHCPELSSLSISLDTRSYELEKLQARSAPGGTGHALRRLNIGSRSTPVVNPELAASLLRGFFPNLVSVHDGSDVRWGEASDWQEVSAVLRRLRTNAVQAMEQ